jgi:Uncharacterized alpha/beta hydrolase domain (DUF2235)
VKRVYQHTHSRPRDRATPRQSTLLDQRLELAERFRRKYRSGDGTDANVYPFFIGVFDTVAAISNRTPAILVILAAFLGMVFALFWALSRAFGFGVDWPTLLVVSTATAVGGAYIGNLLYRIRWEIGLRGSRWWWPLHLLDWRMRFYDRTLNPNVRYARHALAIDERRKSFDRVGWANRGDNPDRPEWLQQIWFAGCHSDIGGSYPEDESRLSDIALKWMLEAAAGVGLKYDPSVLKPYPDATGMQHDETRRFPFSWFAKIDRDIPPDAPLHETVLQRFQAREVMLYDLFGRYRPEGLRRHSAAAQFY